MRQAEGMVRLKLEAEHNLRITRLSSELDSLREELSMRTRIAGHEMNRWRMQAKAAAAAVRDAKEEVRENSWGLGCVACAHSFGVCDDAVALVALL